jgi:hypothetical protein
MPRCHASAFARCAALAALAALGQALVQAQARAADSIRLDAGIRPLAVRARTGPVSLSASNMPPLEGPVIRVGVLVTDEADPDALGLATFHPALAGSLLGEAAAPAVLAILDSGAATHLVSYGDSERLGISWDWLSGSVYPVQGVAGSVELELSVPIGWFAQGVQNLASNGAADPSGVIGQGNVVCLAATELNAVDDTDVPTVLGAPLFRHCVAWIRNSEPVALPGGDPFETTPAVDLLPPGHPAIPMLKHRILLDVLPGNAEPQFLGLLDEIILPTSIAGAGSLYFTANNVTIADESAVAAGHALLDTGAQVTLISEVAATELNMDLRFPEFEVDIRGIGGIITAPGFRLDRITLSAQGGALVWSNVPVVVLNVSHPDPAQGRIFGILGMNLFANRDLVFNGAAPSPYLEVSAPVVPTDIRVTGVRMDWHSQPAPGMLVLESTPDLTPPSWVPVATAALATVQGGFSVTSGAARAYFRVVSP